VSFLRLAFKNIGRNKARTILTLTGVAVAIVAFIALRTVLWSWTAASEFAAKDRIGTRHKVSFIMQLPKRYAEEIAQIPGVKKVAYANWFGAKDPKHENEFFATLAVSPRETLEVYDEIIVKPEQREAWFQNRKGALVGDVLAKKMGWKVGDRIILTGTIYPGDWEFHISGIYTATRASVDRSTLWFHWDYMNDSLPERRRDSVGWIMSRIDDPGKSAQISRTIDTKFDERDLQTLTMSERALNTSFLGMLSAVLAAVNVVSIVILLIMMLVLGNTMAMGVRERIHEYGMMRAIGFLPKHVVVFVIAEAAITGALGGALGLLIAYPIVEKGMGRWLEENMGAYFPFFRIQPTLAVIGFGLAIGLALVAAIIPARQAARLNVIDSLRRVG
jgi:putative ABC transport system permease protein